MIGCFYKRGQVRVEGWVFGVDLVDFGVVDGHEGGICFFRVERRVISFPGVYMASSSFAWERLISCSSTRVISGLLFRMVTRSFSVVYCSEVIPLAGIEGDGFQFIGRETERICHERDR